MCTQRLIDSNERVLTNLDERKDYKAAIDELRSKQEQVMTMLNEIKAASTSSLSPHQHGRRCSSKTFINREVSVSLLIPFYLSLYASLIASHVYSFTYVEFTKTFWVLQDLQDGMLQWGKLS